MSKKTLSLLAILGIFGVYQEVDANSPGGRRYNNDARRGVRHHYPGTAAIHPLSIRGREYVQSSDSDPSTEAKILKLQALKQKILTTP